MASGPKLSPSVSLPQAAPEPPENGPPPLGPEQALRSATASLESGGGPAGGVPWTCGSGTGSLHCSSRSTELADYRPSGTAPIWQSTSPSGAVPATSGADMVYDNHDGYVLLWGGSTGAGLVQQTWYYRSNTWTQVTGTHPPIFCCSSMAYDAADGYVLLFGGANAGTFSSETWRYAGGIWTQLSPTSNPGPRFDAAMTFDAGIGKVLLFGGGSTSYYNDTWTYQGGVWTNITGSLRGGVSPPPHMGLDMSFDSADGYALLFGGCMGPRQGPCISDNQTWTFSNDTWTDLTWHSPHAPSPRQGLSMTYDAVEGEVLLFGGQPATASGLSDTWAFKRGYWTNITAFVGTPPLLRSQAAMTFDPTDGLVVLFGGTLGSTLYGDTWQFFGTQVVPGVYQRLLPTSWTPTEEVNAAITYDYADGYVLLYGGGTTGNTHLAATWTYQNLSWHLVSSSSPPGGLCCAAMTYDFYDGYVVMFGGGTQSNGPLGATWSYRAGVWTALAPTVSPSARCCMEMAWDASDGYALLFGGGNSNGNLGDTWSFVGGQWTPQTSSPSSPPARSQEGLAYDASDGYVLMVDGCVQTTSNPLQCWLSDNIWSYHAGTWTNRTQPSGDPPAASFPGMVYDRGDGFVYLFGGCLAFVTGSACSQWGNDTWAYKAGTWTNVTGSVAPPPRDGPNVAYDEADGYVLIFGGWNTVPLGDMWSYGLPASLTVTASVSPLIIDASQIASFSAVASGGSGIFTSFTWSGLPPGCPNTGAPIFTCAPNAAGSYTPTVTVTDGAVTASATLFILVDPWPTANVTAHPLGGPAPLTVYFSSFAHPGTGTVSSTWRFGDGSPSVSGGNVSHTFTTIGSYIVRLYANDTLGASALVNETVLVGLPPVLSGLGASPSTVDVGSSTLLQANASGGSGIYTFWWQGLPPGCASANQSSLPCRPSAPGTYSIRLQLNDTFGSRAFAGPVSLVVNSLPTLKVSASPTRGTDLLIFQFSSVTTGGTAPVLISWRFGDGQAGAGTTPVHRYTSPGWYNATAWANDSRGSSAVAQVTLQVVAPLSPDFTFSANGTLPSVPVSISASVKGGYGPVSYFWLLNSSTNLTTNPSLSSLSFTPSGEANYTFTLEETDTLGEHVSAHHELWVVGFPWIVQLRAFATANTTSSRVGLSVVLNASAWGGTSPYGVVWSENGTNTTQTALRWTTPTFLHPGTYTYRAWFTDAAGRTAGTSSLAIVVAPALVGGGPGGGTGGGGGGGGGSGGAPSPGSTLLGLPFFVGLALLLVLVALVVAALVLFAARSRRARQQAPSEELFPGQEVVPGPPMEGPDPAGSAAFVGAPPPSPLFPEAQVLPASTPMPPEAAPEASEAFAEGATATPMSATSAWSPMDAAAEAAAPTVPAATEGDEVFSALLRKLGSKEITDYHLVLGALGVGPLPAGELQRDTRIPDGRLYIVLASLTDAGLVMRDRDRLSGGERISLTPLGAKFGEKLSAPRLARSSSPKERAPVPPRVVSGADEGASPPLPNRP